MLGPEQLERLDRVRDRGTIQLLRRDEDLVDRLGREDRHREAMMTGRSLLIELEGLAIRGNVENPHPLHELARGEDGLEVPVVKWIERAAADADVHPVIDAESSASRVSLCSRTNFASMRTSSFTPSPTTAEIS
jgi:hypothetical protein